MSEVPLTALEPAVSSAGSGAVAIGPALNATTTNYYVQWVLYAVQGTPPPDAGACHEA